MTIFAPTLPDNGRPRYVALADAIAQAISEGTLAPGDRLPPQRDLAWRLKVTVGTVSRGYQLAASRGHVSGQIGRGTYVLAPAARIRGTPFHDLPADAHIPLKANLPADIGQEEALRDQLHLLLQEGGHRIADYIPVGGAPHHRAAAALWLRQAGFDLPAERVILTAGAQQAIATALIAASSPGDCILSEALTYHGLAGQVRYLSRRLQTVAIDDQGIVPESFETACIQFNPKALFLVPSLQNPTTAIMPQERRRQIADIARTHNVALIEDDVYAPLLPQMPAPVSLHYPQNSFYVASLSKAVTPGLRIGYLVPPAHMTARTQTIQHTLSQGVPPLMAELATGLIDSGRADALIAAQRREIAARIGIAADYLAGFHIRSNPNAPHIWLSLPEPWRAATFVEAARTRGVEIASGDEFMTNQTSLTDHHVRICVGAPQTREQLRAGLETLAGLLHEAPMENASFA